MAASGRGLKIRLPQVDALRVREVDELLLRLLREIRIEFPPLGPRLLNQIADLKRVLNVRYQDAAALHSRELLRELQRIVSTDIRPRLGHLTQKCDTPELIGHLTRTYGPRAIEVRAHPYRGGGGLALRGFFCRAQVASKRKFLIYLNTSHLTVAVAATFGHELGHYIYGSLVEESRSISAFVEGDFTSHLEDESEFFADSLVGLAAYDKELISRMPLGDGPRHQSVPAFLAALKTAYRQIGPRFNFDLGGSAMGTAKRIRYLTSMIHFFKLRRALFECADL